MFCYSSGIHPYYQDHVNQKQFIDQGIYLRAYENQGKYQENTSLELSPQISGDVIFLILG